MPAWAVAGSGSQQKRPGGGDGGQPEVDVLAHGRGIKISHHGHSLFRDPAPGLGIEAQKRASR